MKEVILQIDSRERNNLHIVEFFNQGGIKTISSKLYIGDYVNFNNPTVIVERKASWLEMAGNLGKQHARFKAELERLDSIGGKMYIVVEETTPLRFWKHKRSQMSGAVMLKIIAAWKQKHNIEVVQCDKQDTGKVITDLLIFGGEGKWRENQ